MAQFKMALIQADFPMLDAEGNLIKALKLCKQAAEEGAKLIVLPEAFNTGYDGARLAEMVELAEDADGKCISAMRKFAKENSVYVIAPIFTPSGNSAENTAFLIGGDGEIIGRYAKTHLTRMERPILVRGTEYPVFDTPLGKIGILICMDVSYPEPWRVLTLKGADMIVLPAAWNTAFRNGWDQMLFTRAQENSVYVAACNRVGPLGENGSLSGDSAVLSPMGDILSQAGHNGDTILYCDVDTGKTAQMRDQMAMVKNRHPEEYGIIAQNLL